MQEPFSYQLSEKVSTLLKTMSKGTFTLTLIHEVDTQPMLQFIKSRRLVL